MSHELLRPANASDLDWLWPAARNARLFATPDALRAFWAEAPWRVRVTTAGEAVVLERWRGHLPLLAMKAVWAVERRVPEIVRQTLATARDQGFSSVLSPLVPEGATRPYERAGMHVRERIVVMRLDRLGRRRPLPPPGDVRLRVGSGADVDSVLALDATCFDDFWRYDRPTLEHYVATERLGIAEDAGRVLGYTLCNLAQTDVVLGRIGVAPEARGTGIGRALLDDAVAYAARMGAPAVTLCTQTENRASQRLYAAAGFRRLPGALAFLVSEEGT